MNSDEERLISECMKHNQKACKSLYDRFSNKMFGLCLRYCSSREEAQDVLHDGFIKVFENLSQLNSDSNLSNWIYTIMLHTAISHWRNSSLLSTTPIDEEVAETEASSCDYDRYDIELIVEAIRQLPDHYRLVFNLHEVEGYSYKEIAQQLSLTEVNVRSLNLRAKQRLAQSLADLRD